jgi:hypothetical protein
LVFYTNKYPLPDEVTEADEVINGVRIETYLVEFDETAWE